MAAGGPLPPSSSSSSSSQQQEGKAIARLGVVPAAPFFQPRVVALAAAATAKAEARQENKRKLSQGSYQQYYFRRKGESEGSLDEDPRIALLQEEWFAGKDYLDIGCNTGKVPWQIFRKFRPRSVVGVDVDVDVIRTANEKLHWAGKRDGGRDYSHCIDFRWEDFVSSSSSSSSEGDGSSKHAPASYDVVSCLSVTKWVQLNQGDEGVKALFQAVHRVLRPGGCLILEPQPWKSYRKRRHVSEVTRRNFDAIQLRPEAFVQYLTSADVGFVTGELLGVPEGGKQAFRRPVYRFVKGGAEDKQGGGGTAITTAPTTTTTTGGAGEEEEEEGKQQQPPQQRQDSSKAVKKKQQKKDTK